MGPSAATRGSSRSCSRSWSPGGSWARGSGSTGPWWPSSVSACCSRPASSPLADLASEGSTLVTFLWLAVLFAMSAQLNELGFMGYVGERLALRLSGLSWPAAFVALAVLYVLMHYLFVSQSAQVLALFGVFADVGVRSGVPAPLMAFTLLFASSYFSTLTPQGGTQNVIFVGSGYLDAAGALPAGRRHHGLSASSCSSRWGRRGCCSSRGSGGRRSRLGHGPRNTCEQAPRARAQHGLAARARDRRRDRHSSTPFTFPSVRRRSMIFCASGGGTGS